MKKYFLVFLILFIGLATNEAFAQNNCDWSAINEAAQKYQTGNFDEVLKILKPCIDNGFSSEQKVQAYRLSAKTYLALDNDSAANLSILELLALEPAFRPDYLNDPPKFIRIIESIKEKGNTMIVTSVSKKEENIYEAPATAILISENQIRQRGYLDLEALLHDLPGFDISRSNGNLYTHAYQRGYRSINTNRTLFLVDGVEENDLWSSNVYLSRQYSLSNIKSIEVVYGPASTMYGSNAFLGVINVITKNPEENIKSGKQIGTTFNTGYGSYNTKFIDGTIAGQNKSHNLALSVTGRYFYSDEQDLSKYPEHDYKPVEMTDALNTKYHTRLDITDTANVFAFLAANPDTAQFYFYLPTDTSIRLTDAGIQRALDLDNDVYTKVKYVDKTKAYSVTAKLRIYDFILGFSTWKKSEGPGAQYTDYQFMSFNEGQAWVPRHTYFFADYKKTLSNKLLVTNILMYKIHDFDKENSVVRFRKNYINGTYKLSDLINSKTPIWDSTYLFQISNQIRNELKLLYQPTPTISIITGFETRFSSIQGDYTYSSKEDAAQTGTSLTTTPGGNHFFSRDLGFYAQADFMILKKLKLTAGARYDNNKIRLDEGYGNVFNPRLAVVYSPESYIFKVIYAEAFKDATNREKYSTASGKRELANPDLQPERVKNIEINIGKNILNQLNINIAGYYSTYTNIIQEVKVARTDGTTTNQNQAKGQALIYGINAFADWHYDNFSAYLNYTYTQPYTINPKKDDGTPLLDENGESYKKLRISDIADNQFNIGGNYAAKNGLNINISSNFVGKKITGVNTTVPTNTADFEAYFLFNGSINYKLIKQGITFQFTVFNILDKEYSSPGLDQVTPDLAMQLRQNRRNMYLSLIFQF